MYSQFGVKSFAWGGDNLKLIAISYELSTLAILFHSVTKMTTLPPVFYIMSTYYINITSISTCMEAKISTNTSKQNTRDPF